MDPTRKAARPIESDTLLRPAAYPAYLTSATDLISGWTPSRALGDGLLLKIGPGVCAGARDRFPLRGACGLACEDLGPVFVKLRADPVVPARSAPLMIIALELHACRTKYRPSLPNQARKRSEEQLGQPIRVRFLPVSAPTTGICSVGPGARRALMDGTEVVVKVIRSGYRRSHRPRIFKLLFLAAVWLERHSAKVAAGPVEVVLRDYMKTTHLDELTAPKKRPTRSQAAAFNSKTLRCSMSQGLLDLVSGTR